MENNQFRFEITPHKFGNFWVRVYKGTIGSDFYLKEDEIMKLYETIKQGMGKYVSEKI